MSWYKTAKFIEAAGGLGGTEDSFLGDNQSATVGTIFDVQRYVMDYYITRVSLSKTSKKISVSVVINSGMFGNTIWEQFWFYDLDEFKKAKDTYKKVQDKAKEVISKFVEEEIPTPLYWASVKKATLDIDPEATHRTNIPNINYSKRYSKDEEPDWRSSIYGNRYPKYMEESEKQYREGHK